MTITVLLYGTCCTSKKFPLYSSRFMQFVEKCQSLFIFIAFFLAIQEATFMQNTFLCSCFLFLVYNSLGYKNTVKIWYEIKLQEARLEAQQDAQYLLQGDVCFQSMNFYTFFCFGCKLLCHPITFHGFLSPFS